MERDFLRITGREMSHHDSVIGGTTEFQWDTLKKSDLACLGQDSRRFSLHDNTTTISKQQPMGGDIASSSTFSDSIVSALATRNVYNPLPRTAQWTMFYNGSVHVYNDVPFNKVQEIMFFARKACNTTTNNVNQKPRATAELCSVAPVFVATKSIPQARKESLVRFLEKRKERITSFAPYGCKNPLKNTKWIDGSSSKSFATDITFSSNCEQFLSLGCQYCDCIDNGDSPSTELHM